MFALDLTHREFKLLYRWEEYNDLVRVTHVIVQQNRLREWLEENEITFVRKFRLATPDDPRDLSWEEVQARRPKWLEPRTSARTIHYLVFDNEADAVALKLSLLGE